VFLSPDAEPWVLSVLAQALAALHWADKAAAAVAVVVRTDIVD